MISTQLAGSQYGMRACIPTILVYRPFSRILILRRPCLEFFELPTWITGITPSQICVCCFSTGTLIWDRHCKTWFYSTANIYNVYNICIHAYPHLPLPHQLSQGRPQQSCQFPHTGLRHLLSLWRRRLDPESTVGFLPSEWWSYFWYQGERFDSLPQWYLVYTVM